MRRDGWRDGIHEPEISNRGFELGLASDLLGVIKDIIVGGEEQIVEYFEKRRLFILFIDAKQATG